MSSVGIRYGKIETLIIDPITNTAETTTETVHDYVTTNSYRRYTMSVFADDRRKVTAELLKLIDRLDDTGCINIGFECDRKGNGSKYKMLVSWTVPSH